MKRTKMLTILVLALSLMVCPSKLAGAEPIGTAFTYQGHLYDANYPADGLYDFQFKLYDDPCDPCDANQVGGDVNKPDVDVIAAHFTVELDFGEVFYGNVVWLEIGVRQGELKDPNVYTVLQPRQEITPTPYALYAVSGLEIEARKTKGTATFIIAASDTHAEGRRIADYICDGTDDDIQIQAALDALPSSGGRIHLLEGTYIISFPITPTNSDWELTGCGRGSILKLADGVNDRILVLVSNNSGDVCRRYTVAYLKFDGNKANQTTAAPLIVVDCDTHSANVVFGYFDQIFVTNSKGAGMFVDRPSQIGMDHSWVYLNDSHGIEHDHGGHFDLNTVRITHNGGDGYHNNIDPEGAKFTHCWFNFNTGNGAYLLKESMIANCHFYGNGKHGLENCFNNTVSGGRIMYNVENGIFYLQNSVLTNVHISYNDKEGIIKTIRSSITNCWIYKNSQSSSGMYPNVQVYEDTIVSNCMIGVSSGATGRYAIRGQTAAVSQGCIITGNILHKGTVDVILKGCWKKDGRPNKIYGNQGTDETLTAGSPTLHHWGATNLDSSGGAITGTLPDGFYIGQTKAIVMVDASNSSIISVTHHETSDPEVFTFDAEDETLVLVWTGTEWATIKESCTH